MLALPCTGSQDPETNLSSLESSAKVNGDMTSYLKDIGVCPCARPKLTSTKAEVEAQAAVNPEDILSSDHKEGLPSEEKNKRASNFLKEVSYCIPKQDDTLTSQIFCFFANSATCMCTPVPVGKSLDLCLVKFSLCYAWLSR